MDAMGSDRAPHPETDGALTAASDLGVGVILVGQHEVVEKELRRCGGCRDGDKGVSFVEAPEFIVMDEAVATAKMVIGMLSGVDRLALMPTKSGRPMPLLDVGVNVECKAYDTA